ncbi:uncharacterized protein PV09_05587 [Verruconis gallopava]|uniref:Fatty acid hydroxylase domain-containing protein n=1 Tax=Verruconis gallopava TaxID=253628 RepID=A0A0D2AW45_9PEZI|nr:uncharacterized protein PV09_05587 [Verruconis gallopava]KIW03379.1 hypothetical protein PV09_05587 [Verruconis gallopava]
MGAAISLPFISFFALPALTSYGTSVNLLFFTLNWYILLLTHPPLSVEIIGISVVQLLCYILPALLFLLFDTGLPSIATAIKTQGDIALAGRLGRKRVAKIAAWSVLNVALGVALQLALELLLTKVLRMRTALSLSKRMPMPWTIAQQALILVLVRGILQYYIHRFVLHNPNVFLSKYHVAWQHAIPAPFSICASYDSPPCYLLHHWVPLFVPAIAMRAHILPVLFALAITSLETLVTYSGYSILPSGILLPGMAKRVDNHFLVQGQGNYAAFGALDWCHGTSVGRDLVDDMKAEWEKHDGDAKIQMAGEKAGNLVDGIGDKVRARANAGRKKASGRS